MAALVRQRDPATAQFAVTLMERDVLALGLPSTGLARARWCVIAVDRTSLRIYQGLGDPTIRVIIATANIEGIHEEVSRVGIRRAHTLQLVLKGEPSNRITLIPVTTFMTARSGDAVRAIERETEIAIRR
jgi:hypothetical protein